LKRDELLAQIGKRIRELRTAAQLTQARLAEDAGISNEFLSKIECGHTAPSVVTLNALAEALGVSLQVVVQEASPVSCSVAAPVMPRVQQFVERTGPAGERLLLNLADTLLRLAERHARAAVPGRGAQRR